MLDQQALTAGAVDSWYARRRRPASPAGGVSAQAVRCCIDYTVESPDGRIGTVTSIRYDPGEDRLPAAVVVRAGRNGTRRLVIPVSQLSLIRAPQRRVTLEASPRISASEPAPSSG